MQEVEKFVNYDAAAARDVRSASLAGRRRDEVWHPPETLQAFVTAGCRTLIPELVAIFKADTESRLQAMDEAIASGNLPVVRHHIRSLKRCSRLLGADRMAVICEHIESEDPDTLARELPEQLKELGAVYGQIVRAMDIYV